MSELTPAAPTPPPARVAPSSLAADVAAMAELWPWAEAFTATDLVPKAYRGKPANAVLVALYGQSLGLNFAESMQRLHVVNGRPTMAAELIIARVREAGHRIETGWDAERRAAWCTITRGDGGNPHTVWRTYEWARQMGLADKEQYRAQPEYMLQYRAATLGARLVCPDALHGVIYSTDELAEATAPARATVAVVDVVSAEPRPMPQLGARQAASGADPDGATAPEGDGAATHGDSVGAGGGGEPPSALESSQDVTGHYGQ